MNQPPVDDLQRRLLEAEKRLRVLEQGQAFAGNPEPAAQEKSDGSLFGAMGLWKLAALNDPEVAQALEQSELAKMTSEQKAKKKWYEKLSIRGYSQFRFNEDNTYPGSALAQYVGDRSVGSGESFLLRRARVILSGEISEHVAIYIQPDFASSVPGSTTSNHFTQLRDWYADIFIDVTKVHRFRVGQSKVPYGWENMQSSSNRLALDRNDAFNSEVPNERDLGVFYYWTPEDKQELLRYVLEQGLKGSGNYGVFGIGIYNGQGGSIQEQNDNVHLVSRFTWPFMLSNGQIMEASIQGVTGKYVVSGSSIRPLGKGAAFTPLGTVGNTGANGLEEYRLGWTYIIYPQPIGFQTEYTIGRGPALNNAQTQVINRDLHGGYAQLFYKHDTDHMGIFIPYLRYQYFQGGYRSQANAPYVQISETELGVEWQITPAMELVTAWVNTDRTNTTAMNVPGVQSYQQFVGNIFRVQFQVNY